jgi:hypothetical protein
VRRVRTFFTIIKGTPPACQAGWPWPGSDAETRNPPTRELGLTREPLPEPDGGGGHRADCGPCPGPVHPGEGRARSGVAAPVVAGGEQPRAADVQRHLPADCPSRPRMRGRSPSASVPAPFQPYLARPRGSGGRPDGAERLVLPQMPRRCGASARSARARRSYDRIMDMP